MKRNKLDKTIIHTNFSYCPSHHLFRHSFLCLCRQNKLCQYLFYKLLGTWLERKQISNDVCRLFFAFLCTSNRTQKKLFCVSLCLWIVLLLHSDALKYREKYFLASFSRTDCEFSCNSCVSFEKRFMWKTIFSYDLESNVISQMKNIFCLMDF